MSFESLIWDSYSSDGSTKPSLSRQSPVIAGVKIPGAPDYCDITAERPQCILLLLTVPVAATQTDRGLEQAHAAGDKIRGLMESDGIPYKLYFYM